MKIRKIVGIFNIGLSAFLFIIFLAFIFSNDSNSDGWGDIFIVLIGLFFTVFSILLTIPVIIQLVKHKLPAIQFYFYTHVSLVSMSLLLLGSAFIKKLL